MIQTPTNSNANRRRPGNILVSAFKRLIVFLLGYDLFISYRRADANQYALRLANRLTKRGFRCYLDQFSSHADPELPEEVKTALTHSAGLVVIGSPLALASKAIPEELTIFSTLKRPIFPVNVAGTLTDDTWADAIKGISRAEETLLALQANRPSRDVITRLVDSTRFRRRNEQLKRIFLGLLTAMGLVVAVGVLSVLSLNRKVNAANRQAATAEQNRVTAVNSANDAEERRKTIATNLDTTQGELKQKLDDLRIAGEKLTTATKDVEKAQGLTRKAQQQEATALKSAEEKRREAERLGNLAGSRSLLAEGEGFRALGSSSFEAPAKLAVQAYERYESSEPDSLLRYGLNHVAKRLACDRKSHGDGSVRFSDDGKRLYSINSDNVTRVIDSSLGPHTGEEIGTITLPRYDAKTADESEQPQVVKRSADGRFVAAIYPSSDDQDVLQVSAIENPTNKMSIKLADGYTDFDIGSNGSLIATLHEGQLQVWRFGDSRPIMDLKDKELGEAGYVFLSPNGKFVMAERSEMSDASEEATKIWNIATKQELLPKSERPEHQDFSSLFMRKIEFSSDDRYVAVSVEGNVSVYDTEEKKYVTQFKSAGNVDIIAFCSLFGRKALAVAYSIESGRGGMVQFYPLDDGGTQIEGLILRHSSPVQQMIFLPAPNDWSPTRVLTLTGQNVHLWELESSFATLRAEEITRIDEIAATSVAIATPVSTRGSVIAIRKSNGNVQLWEAPSTDQVMVLSATPRLDVNMGLGRRFAVAITQSDKPLLPGHAIVETRIVNAVTGEVQEVEFAKGQRDAIISDDGRHLLSETAPITIKDLTTNREITLPNSYQLLDKKAFSPDLQYVAVHGPEAGGCQIIRLYGGAAEPIRLGQNVARVVFSPDGDHFAVVRKGSSEVELRSIKDTATNAKHGVLAHGSPVTDILFSERGGYLAVTFGADLEQSVTLWTQIGVKVRTANNKERILGVDFSANEKRLAVLYQSGNVQAFDTAQQQASPILVEAGPQTALIALDSSGDHLAASSGIRYGSTTFKSAAVWDLHGEKAERLITIPLGDVPRQLYFNAADKHLVVLLQNRLVLVPWRTSDLVAEVKSRLDKQRNCDQ